MGNKDIKGMNVKLKFKKRPIKNSIIYLVLLIIIAVAAGFGFYKYIYKSEIAFLATPIILVAGILINTRAIINIVDFIFNSYVVTTAVCTDVEYKYDKKNNLSDKYSKVYFIDYKTNNKFEYKFNYRANFSKGNVYRITRGKFSSTYVSVFR